MALKTKDVIEATYQGLKFAKIRAPEIEVINSCYAEAGIPAEFYFDMGLLKWRDSTTAPTPTEPVV